jgi:hypothetical protein
MKAAGVAIALGALLAGCASGRHGAPPLEQFLPYAGAPVDEFRYFTFDGWQVLDRYRVVLWVDVSTAYLITVRPPCIDLDFTERLGVSSTFHVVSRFESLFPERREPCPITEIRPIDLKRMNADRAAAQR